MTAPPEPQMRVAPAASPSPAVAPSPRPTERLRTNGGDLWLEDGHTGRPFPVRGVTYGTFADRGDGHLFPDTATIRRDLERMAAVGLSCLRTYTLPPPDLLELAAETGLRVLVGLDFDDWRITPGTDRRARRTIRRAALAETQRALDLVAGDPTVLGVAVGNELPVDLVRLHGAAAVAAVYGEMIDRLHDGDPDLLATYVNFPTTEYLEVPGQDLVAMNVFLDDPGALAAYVRRLQVIHEGRPVVVTEVGVPHVDHDGGARLAQQLTALDEVGAGAFVFAWSDDWVVGGNAVRDWGFGLTDERHEPRRALVEIDRWCSRRGVRDVRDDWPSVSVVVCARNEERMIDTCVRSVLVSDYPDLELIVCDDGSTDDTAAIVDAHVERSPERMRLLRLDHGGLSRARNAGAAAARGEIIAYLDADAACLPHWPYHLALSMETGADATGGPNLPFDGAGFAERVVAAGPGNPRQVLLADDRAEHVPGCNLTVRRSAIERLGGFNPRYTSAGDDVDLGWRLLDDGATFAYAPRAEVHHHRRDTLRGYLRQQRGYGRAERLLADVHRHRFNRLGQARWSGTVYGVTPLLPRILRPVVYTGWQGQAPYQTVARRRADVAASTATALVPVIATTGLLAALTTLVAPVAGVVAVAAVVLLAFLAAAIAVSVPVPHREEHPFRYRLVAGGLHVAQPLARTWGLLRTRPERRALADAEWWGQRDHWLGTMMQALDARGVHTVAAGDGMHWDLGVRWGTLAVGRLTLAVVWSWEPRHRLRLRPSGLAVVTVVAALVASTIDPLGAVVAAFVLAATIVSLLVLRRRVGAAVAATTRPTADPDGGA